MRETGGQCYFLTFFLIIFHFYFLKNTVTTRVDHFLNCQVTKSLVIETLRVNSSLLGVKGWVSQLHFAFTFHINYSLFFIFIFIYFSYFMTFLSSINNSNGFQN